jgi:hypothetical protein
MMTHREFRALFPEFNAPSWATWNAIEDAIHGAEPTDVELVKRITGRSELPSSPVSEFWAVKGRGGGGSRFCARTAAYFACGRSYRLAPGEHIYIGIFAPTQKQAQITHGYVRGLLRSIPALAQLIVNETRDSIELSNGVVIEVIAASTAAPRGRAYGLAIVEEASFLPTDKNADPDVELMRGLRPGLARVPDSLLMVISSPFAQRGELYRTHRQKFGTNDRHTLVVAADTMTLNPAFEDRARVPGRSAKARERSMAATGASNSATTSLDFSRRRR